MKLQKKKITGLLAAVLLLSANITAVPVTAQADQYPSATLTLEPKRTADGIDYDVYIEHANYLSTLMFEVDFTSNETGAVSVTENDCFDIAHSKWDRESPASLKAYLGRTGQKVGFSSDDKIKIAQISIPIAVSQTGEVTASVSGASCAGVTQLAGNAVKGTVSVSDNTVKYRINECSILSFDKNKVNILSANDRKADVIYASYDDKGSLIKFHKESVELKQGENEISANAASFDKAKTVSLMIWDCIDSMTSLADKATINN